MEQAEVNEMILAHLEIKAAQTSDFAILLITGLPQFYLAKADGLRYQLVR